MVYSREIRIYPLQKSSLELYEQMIDFLFIPKKQYWITYNIVPIQFEFQKGSNTMLCLDVMFSTLGTICNISSLISHRIMGNYIMEIYLYW